VVGTEHFEAVSSMWADAHPDRALALALDVTDAAHVTAATEQAEKRFGGVDVLVNNGGYGYRAAVEEGDDADVQRLFATNFFGAVAMIKAVLPGMRARRHGAIVNISSIAAKRTPPGSGYYAAAKAAIEGLTGSLRAELKPLGITAMVVEPGASAPTSQAARSPGRRRPSATTPTRPGSGERRTTRSTAPSPATPPEPHWRSSQPWRPQSRPPCSCSERTR
jgi:NAD(P)-dependent dehydrogenase (short-subunit alcohol dehydrogenase family)